MVLSLLRLLPLVVLLAACEPADVPAQEPSPVETTTGTYPADVPVPDSLTAARFRATMAYADSADLRALPVGERMIRLGQRFEGTPYEAGMLDVTTEETLICRLDAFDCFTFVESILAMARGIEAGDPSWEGYAQRMRQQRYRNGEQDGYCSRMHYFTEWIADNAARGHLRRVTDEAGGVERDKALRFMSEHRESYPQLASDSLYACIVKVEQGLDSLRHVYIPQDEIAEAYPHLQAGDVIAMATDIGGLDVTHTGLAIPTGEGRFGLLHASTTGGVKVSPDLRSYVQNIDAQTGIVVARPTGR